MLERMAIHTGGLFTKSFRGDLDRLVVLCASIERYALGAVDYIVACPFDDLDLFRRTLPSWVDVRNETEFTHFEVNGRMGVWREQQLVKMMFGLTGEFERFVILDSDSYFVRPFALREMVGEDDRTPLVVTPNYYRFRADDPFIRNLALGNAGIPTPYDLKRVAFADDAGDFQIDRSLLESSEHAKRTPSELGYLIQKAFGYDNRVALYFMPTPIVWNSAILMHMWREVRDLGLSFGDLLRYSPWEALWYGHYVMKRHPGVVVPCEPFFMHIAEDTQVDAARSVGVTEESISVNFLGLTLAARHQKDLRLTPFKRAE